MQKGPRVYMVKRRGAGGIYFRLLYIVIFTQNFEVSQDSDSRQSLRRSADWQYSAPDWRSFYRVQGRLHQLKLGNIRFSK